MSMSMTLRPRVSEKAYALSQTHNVYVFEVPVDANSVTVTDAVEAQFSVTVSDVNILNVKGKTKRTVRRGGRQTMGRRRDFKKAYVTLKEGDSIVLFPNENDADKAAANPAAAPKTKKEKK
jgi:large subunit ribosomal protein L23